MSQEERIGKRKPDSEPEARRLYRRDVRWLQWPWGLWGHLFWGASKVRKTTSCFYLPSGYGTSLDLPASRPSATHTLAVLRSLVGVSFISKKLGYRRQRRRYHRGGASDGISSLSANPKAGELAERSL
jgi:hypothetical protein